MVKIKKGKLKTEVAKSAYENFYKSAGWLICDEYNMEEENLITEKEIENVTKEVEEEISDESGKDEWPEDWQEDIEKPLSEMDISELREKAASLGINTSNLNAKQIRQKIRNHTS